MSPEVERIVLHWGDMGARWGVNRSVAQVHALLYLSPHALNAEQIAEALTMARSNVSTSLRELLAWNLIEAAPVLGDRRDFYVARQDLWDLALAIADERKKREIDPTLAFLRSAAADAAAGGRTDPDVMRRIAAMAEFVETVTRFYTEVRALPRPVLTALLKLGGRIARFVGR